MLRTGLKVFFLAWLVIPVVAGLGGSLLAAASPTNCGSPDRGWHHCARDSRLY